MSDPIRDLPAERHVATIGVLNLASAVTMTLLAGMTLLGVLGADEPALDEYYVLSGAFFLLLGAVNVVIWRGLKEFSRAAWLVQLIVGAVALAGFPLGTSWGGYALWALGRSRGRALFDPAYAAARRQDPPDSRARAHVPAVVVVVVVGVAIAIAGLFTARRELAVLVRQQQELEQPPAEELDEEQLRGLLERLREEGEPAPGDRPPDEQQPAE